MSQAPERSVVRILRWWGETQGTDNAQVKKSKELSEQRCGTLDHPNQNKQARGRGGTLQAEQANKNFVPLVGRIPHNRHDRAVGTGQAHRQ